MSAMDDLKAAAAKLAKIESAIDRWAKVAETLAKVNKYGKPGTSWTMDICLHSDSYGDNRVNITARLPFEVVQQQAVTAVVSAEREIRVLGGEVPAKARP